MHAAITVRRGEELRASLRQMSQLRHHLRALVRRSCDAQQKKQIQVREGDYETPAGTERRVVVVGEAEGEDGIGEHLEQEEVHEALVLTQDWIDLQQRQGAAEPLVRVRVVRQRVQSLEQRLGVERVLLLILRP